MKNLQQEFNQLPFSHHSYGIENSSLDTESFMKLFPQENFSYVIHKKYDMLKIADAREIKSLQSEKTDKPSIFILEFSFINREAQNALLKVLEEPASQTYFILLFPDRSALLPTLRSRLFFITTDNEELIGQNNFATPHEFESLSLQKRFELIKTKTDKKKDVPISKSDVLKFIDGLEVYESSKDNKNFQLLEVLFQSRTSLHANGASIKMVLDLIALHV